MKNGKKFLRGPTAFSLRLRRARLDKGLSQTDIAAVLGVTQSVIAQYESGSSTPLLHSFAKMVQFYGADANELLLGRGIDSDVSSVKRGSADRLRSSYVSRDSYLNIVGPDQERYREAVKALRLKHTTEIKAWRRLKKTLAPVSQREVTQHPNSSEPAPEAV